MYRFRLPLPPTTNHLYPSIPGRGRVKSAEYKSWLDRADKLYREQRLDKFPTLTGPIHFQLTLPRIRGDIDNRIKVPLDYCVSRNITGDDRNTCKITIEVDRYQKKDICWVTLEELK